MKKDKPLISVVVPAYNVEKYIKRCINALIIQSYSNLEIIIVNDGSKDKTEAIALEYQTLDKRIKVISQKNKGLSGARNTGIEYTNGDYIGFIDSDDWIPVNYYEELYNLIERYDADVVTTDFLRVSKEIETKPINTVVSEVVSEEEILRNYILSGVQGKAERMAAWSKLYKKSIVGDIRFEEGRIYEDIYFNWNVYKRCKKVVLANGIFYYYFINPISITKTSFSNSVYDLVHAADMIVNDFTWNDSKLQILIEQYRARADFSVLVRMIKGDCKDINAMLKQKKLVNESFKLLFFSQMPYSRKVALLMFKFFSINILLKLRKLL